MDLPIDPNLTRCAWAKGRCLDDIRKEFPVDLELIPDLVSHIAWSYAEKVFKRCAEDRIVITAELSRVSKAIHQEYRNRLIDQFGIRHVRKAEQQMDDMLEDLEGEFNILWFSVNNELKRVYPDIMYDEMRTDAKIALMMIDYLQDHLDKVAKIISSRAHYNPEIVANPLLKKLQSVLYAYCGDYDIRYNEHMSRWIQIFKIKVRSII